MDRGRRAEPYSNATIWTREIARNLAGHLSRVSKAHSCVDTRSPKSTRLPQFHHSYAQKRCPTSPMKTRQHLAAIPRPSGEQEVDFRGLGGGSAREETDGAALPNHSVEINQEVSDRRVRIPAVKPPARLHTGNENGTTTGDITTYDTPLALPHQRNRLAHDYYKRQEQRKIWQENQALNKRLQSTKATLNSKEWEKDGKWTQEFLKNQEKRRSALQQELRRAQVSPQAVLRSKPLKSLHPHHLKTALNHADSDKDLDLTSSPTRTDVVGALSARKSGRRSSKGQVQFSSRGNSEATVPQASAANHRRIMELRKQKPSPLCPVQTTISSTGLSTPDTTNPAASDEQAAYIPDNEIVSVRFTFSRGRSRGSDTNSTDVKQTDPPGSLDVDERDRDTMSLSGAFSPGVELETALNAVAVADTTFDPRENNQPQQVVADVANEAPVDASGSQQNEEDECSNNVADSIVNRGDEGEALQDVRNEDEDGSADNDEVSQSAPETIAVAAANVHDESDEKSAVAEPEHAEEVAASQENDVERAGTPNEDKSSASLPEQEQAQQPHSDEEHDEAYDGDNFDDYGLPSARATDEQPRVNDDKHEASGYGSEFEEVPDVNPFNVAVTNSPEDNQGEGNDEDEEYSNDDFAD